MGNKRDLSEKTFQYVLDNIEKRNSDFEWFDYGIFGWHLWGHTNLKSDMSNVKNYLLDLADEEDKSKKQITDIRNNVFGVEGNYTAQFKQNTGEMIALTNIANKMANCICVDNFKTSFNINSLINNISSDIAVLLTNVDYKVILAKKWDEITPEEYRQVAWLLMTTKDACVVEDIITGCYDQSCETSAYFLFIKGVSSYYYKPNMEKLQILHGFLQANTYCLIADASDSTDPDKIAALQKSGMLVDGIQRTQLLESIMAYAVSNPNSQISGDKNHPSLSIIVDQGHYIVEYYSNILINTENAAGNPWIDVDSTEIKMTISKPSYDNSAATQINNETVNYTIAVTGLTSDAAWGDALDGVMSTGNDTLINYVSKFVPVIGTGKSVYDGIDKILIEPYEKAIQLQDFKRVIDASNAGIVVASFNLTYTSTDINGDINKHSYTLYPSAADGNILSSMECVKNFNENLLNNPKFENERKLMVDSKVVPENGIDINYVLNNPKEIGEMLSQLNVYLISNGHSLNELTDTPYIPQEGR